MRAEGLRLRLRENEDVRKLCSLIRVLNGLKGLLYLGLGVYCGSFGTNFWREAQAQSHDCSWELGSPPLTVQSPVSDTIKL